MQRSPSPRNWWGYEGMAAPSPKTPTRAQYFGPPAITIHPGSMGARINAEPLVSSSNGKVPLNLKTFGLFDVQRKQQIFLIFCVLRTGESSSKHDRPPPVFQ